MIRGFIFFVLSLILSYTFFMSGSNKLFPVIPALHEQLIEGAKLYPQVFTQLPFDDTQYRLILGSTQILASMVLLGCTIGLVGNCVDFVATLGLFIQMAGATYFHVQTQTDPTITIALAAMLVVRLLFRKRSCC
eukprot:UN02795